MNNATFDVADKSAVAISGLCLMHCILPPSIAIFAPYFTGLAFFEKEALHLWLLLCVTPISLIAITWGYKQHKRRDTLLITLTGLALLLAAATIGHYYFGHEVEIVATILGSVLLVAGHIRNLRQRHNTQQELYAL